MKKKFIESLCENTCKYTKNSYRDPITGVVVLTQAFLEKRGWCCKTGCVHCPYDYNAESDKTKIVGKVTSITGSNEMSLNSNQEVVIINTGEEEYILKRKNTGTGIDPILTDLVGKNVICKGVPHHRLFLLESWKIV